MTAPTVSSFTTFPLGPGQATDNITGLANNNARGLGIVGSSSTPVDYKDIKVGDIQITTGTVPGSPNGTGTASLYLALSEDGSTFTDFLNPTSTNGGTGAGGEGLKFVVSQSLATLLVQKIFCPASATAYVFNAFSVLQKIGFVPTCCSVYIVNNTGAAFGTSSSGFIAGYRTVTFN